MDAYDEDHMLAEIDYSTQFYHEPAPYWYDPKSFACEHSQGNDVRQLGSQVAASDGVYKQMQCVICGRVWSRFLEG